MNKRVLGLFTSQNIKHSLLYSVYSQQRLVALCGCVKLVLTLSLFPEISFLCEVILT
jgi:hypothetical protein